MGEKCPICGGVLEYRGFRGPLESWYCSQCGAIVQGIKPHPEEAH